MILKGEECQAHVREDEVLRQEVQDLKQLQQQTNMNCRSHHIFKETSKVASLAFTTQELKKRVMYRSIFSICVTRYLLALITGSDPLGRESWCHRGVIITAPTSLLSLALHADLTTPRGAGISFNTIPRLVGLCIKASFEVDVYSRSLKKQPCLILTCHFLPSVLP